MLDLPTRFFYVVSLCFVQIGQDFEVTFAFIENDIRVYNERGFFFETPCKHPMDEIEFVQVEGGVDLSDVIFRFKE